MFKKKNKLAAVIEALRETAVTKDHVYAKVIVKTKDNIPPFYIPVEERNFSMDIEYIDRKTIELRLSASSKQFEWLLSTLSYITDVHTETSGETNSND